MSIKYAESHEWARLEDDGLVTIGISQHAQNALGDIVYVELPEVGATCAVGEDVAVIESVKAASDIYMPINGTVIETNTMVEDNPEVVNAEPLGDGWLFRIDPSDVSELDLLLSPDDYTGQQDD